MGSGLQKKFLFLCKFSGLYKGQVLLRTLIQKQEFLLNSDHSARKIKALMEMKDLQMS